MRLWIVLAGVNGALAVASGAYAAHGLGSDAYLQGLLGQASLYQLVHAVALIGVDRLVVSGRRLAHGSAVLFLMGIVLFSGSLTWKVLNGGAGLSIPMLTPVGGLSFIAGWLVLMLAGFGRGREV